jgi:ribosomal protein S18 acetylase RimI-like enzyme
VRALYSLDSEDTGNLAPGLSSSVWSKIPLPPEVHIRKIEAADLPSVAAIHMMAFPESALTMLGTEAVRRYYEWQLIGPHEVAGLSARVNSELVGFCFGGVFRGAMSGFLHKNRKFLIWRVLTHPWFATNPIFRERLTFAVHILKRFGKSKAPVPHTKDPTRDSFAILAIATDPCRQGLGVGKLLMKESEDIARKRGFREMSLTVHPDNHRAIRFYVRLDWEKLSENGVWGGGMKKSINS